MTILSYQSIKNLCQRGFLIPQWTEATLHNGRTYGLSSCGYDIRIKETIWVFPLFGRLAHAMEYFNMPSDVMGEVKDKSTNARLFFLVQNTVIEPGWYGDLTLEITSDRPWPRRIKAGTPIAQIIFKWLDAPTEKPYNGKYQGQSGTTKAKLPGRGTSFWVRLFGRLGLAGRRQERPRKL